MSTPVGSSPYPTTAPDAGVIAELAERALAEIPATLLLHIAGVGIQIADFADDETLDAMGIESAWDLTGLYTGTPIGSRSVGDITRPPDLIFLYRLPILMEWIETGEDLGRLVRNVVIHEIAHHLGFSEDEIEALERE
jgi:predicted Zn-dependent protease with MMP-like domain